jgi:hypothetical protein
VNKARLVPQSNNEGNTQTELKEIWLIVVHSHVTKILDKANMAKLAAVGAPNLLQMRIYRV